MLSGPYHPLVRYDELPSWMRFTSGGLQMDAEINQPFRGVSHRILLPQTGTVGYRANAIISQSSLASTANGHEGIGIAVDGYVREGETRNARRVYSNELTVAADPKLWVNGQWGTARDVAFIGEISSPERPDFLDVTYGIRGTGGSVTFDDLGFRYFYQRLREAKLGITDWTNVYYQSSNPFTRRIAQGMAGGRDVELFAKDVAVWPLVALAGQRVNLDVVIDIDRAGIGHDTLSGGTANFNLGVAVRMVRRDGSVRWWGTGIASEDTTQYMEDKVLAKSDSFLLEKDIKQVEPFVWMRPRNIPWDGAVPTLKLHSLRVTFKALDHDLGTGAAL